MLVVGGGGGVGMFIISCRTRLFPPLIIFFPPMGTRLTVFVSDGSNRTAVPEQMLSRLLYIIYCIYCGVMIVYGSK